MPVGPYEPGRLKCSFVPTKARGSVAGPPPLERHPPCFLFARKLHSEAVNYFGQALTTFFLSKSNASLARHLAKVEAAQLAAAQLETQSLLTGKYDPAEEVEDYSERAARDIMALVPPSFTDLNPDLPPYHFK